MTSVGPPVCLDCKHWHADASPPACDAFPAPGRIPSLVWIDGDEHRKPIDGDHGIQFEPKDKS
jgi:hypothetical protein